MDLQTGAMPGDEAVPDGRMKRWMDVTLMRGRRRVCQAALATAKRTGITKAGFCIATKDQPREGSSKVPAERVGRGGMGVAVTEHRDEDQEGRGRRTGGGRTSANT